MESARAKGIGATAIRCGGGDASWQLGSTQTKMGYFEIDANRVVAHIAAPQDAEIARLGDALNDTYIPFGAAGTSGSARQAAQDNNAARAQPGSRVWRAMAKSSDNDVNDSWDLGDHLRDGNLALGQISERDLPPIMRGMTLAQRQDYVDQKRAERTRIQRRIQELGNERTRFLATAPAAPGGADSLDAAMLRALTAQARAAGFQLE